MKNSNESKMILDFLGKFFEKSFKKHEDIDVLDFGCGSGEFASQYIVYLKEKISSFSAVEPVLENHASIDKNIAAGMELKPIKSFGDICDIPEETLFDLIVSNHVLYYVPDISKTVDNLVSKIKNNGFLLITMASPENTLIKFWQKSFSKIGISIPFNQNTDLMSTLEERRIKFQTKKIEAGLDFSDTSQNRIKIGKFLLGDYFYKINEKEISYFFEEYSKNGRVIMELVDNVYIINGEITN
ncbi:MAG: class I SAM-dependent methyltransferase [Bdellovibrionales bacterium]